MLNIPSTPPQYSLYNNRINYNPNYTQPNYAYNTTTYNNNMAMNPNYYMNGVNGYDPNFINQNMYMNQRQTAYMNPNFQVGQVGQQPNQVFNQFNGYGGYPTSANQYMGMSNPNQFQYFQYKK